MCVVPEFAEVTVIDLLSQQKFEEALQTAQDVQEQSQQIGRPLESLKLKSVQQ